MSKKCYIFALSFLLSSLSLSSSSSSPQSHSIFWGPLSLKYTAATTPAMAPDKCDCQLMALPGKKSGKNPHIKPPYNSMIMSE